MLDEQQRQTLLTLARRAIAAVFEGHRLEVDQDDFDQDLRRLAGTFVTVHEGERELRGCIGSVEAHEPLYQSVASNAVNAAFRDPRFRPLSPEELSRVQLEISVLTPFQKVENVEEIVPGRDGLLVRRGRNAGLLLPQVASEYGWDRETFLSQTCLKAGLPPSSWRDPQTTIERFSAEVFGE
jgi:AmmeMemoRadiSam system protein A